MSPLMCNLLHPYLKKKEIEGKSSPHHRGQMASGFGALSHKTFLFLLLLSIVSINKSSLSHAANGSTSAEVMRPMTGTPRMQSVLLNEKRRRLGSFQICAVCTCCGGPKGLCLPSPCCYAINCNIPNRPFGFCSFTPKACNCFGCQL